MLSLSEIEKQYPPGLQAHKRFMLREYVQHKIMQIVYKNPFGSKLAFIGGTCLRIVHGNTRFSEDIDFDNFDIDENTFEKVADIISAALSKEGYKVEIKTVYK